MPYDNLVFNICSIITDFNGMCACLKVFVNCNCDKTFLIGFLCCAVYLQCKLQRSGLRLQVFHHHQWFLRCIWHWMHSARSNPYCFQCGLQFSMFLLHFLQFKGESLCDHNNFDITIMMKKGHAPQVNEIYGQYNPIFWWDWHNGPPV